MRNFLAALIALIFWTPLAIAGGPRFSATGGVGSANSTLSQGEFTGGAFNINGTTGKGMFNTLNMVPGSGPPNPTNGDCWTTGISLVCRINGANVQFGTGAGNGTVTSVGISPPSFLTAGSAVPSSGSIPLTLTPQLPNQVFAAPNGSNGTPSFRALVAGDIPTLNQNSTGTAANITGVASVANGGTGASLFYAAQNNLPYLNPATGATPRSYYSKWSDTTSVLDFAGVDPTGAADSTAGINNALASICSKGGTLYFPAGTYLIGSNIPVACDGVYIRGAGNDSTLLKLNSATSGMWTFTGNKEGISELSIAAAVPQTGGAYIFVNGSSGFTSHDIAIDGAFVGVNDRAGAIHWYDRYSITNTVAKNGVAFYQSGQSNDVYLSHFLTGANINAQPLACVRLNDSGATWITSSDFINCGYGLLADPQTARDWVNWVFVSDTAFDTNSQAGILIAPVNASAYVTGMFFSGVWSATNKLQGIHISGAGAVTNINFDNAHLLNNYQEGLRVDAGGARGQINLRNSQVSGNSFGSTGLYAGVYMDAGIRQFSITDNLIGQTGTFSNSQNQAINIAAGAGDAFVITNNDLRNNALGLQDASAGVNKVITGNLGFNPQGGTVLPPGSSPFSWTNNKGYAAVVFISGGAVSAVTVDGRSITPAASMQVLVPPGRTMVVTYSSTPSIIYNGLN